MAMRVLPIVLVLSLLPSLALGEAPTERYAPAQLRVAQALLEQARARAALGEVDKAGRLAWQASFDARLAWGMTESEHLRAEAAEVGGAASALITRLHARR
jgi:hypothetical protein